MTERTATLAASPRPPFPNGYTARQAAHLIGVPVRRIHEFVRAGFLDPRRGPHGEYRFSFRDLVLLRSAHALAGTFSARKVRRALRELRRRIPQGGSLTDVHLAAVGGRLVVRDGRTSWIPESGQTLLEFDPTPEAGHRDQVRATAHETLQHAPEAAEAGDAEDWYELGCELEDHDVDQALEAYRRALACEPHHVDAHVNCGRLLHERGRYAEAERHYRRALECEPEDATAAFDLGVLLQDLGRDDEAIHAYERALAADPDHADAHYNLAVLLEQRGVTQAAVRHLALYRRLRSEA